jgi:antibiotic biosynthesis monooxygenase (ABM) superfamily enzyme
MKPPPRWKRWLVSLLAVYPLVLAFQALVVPGMLGLPLPLRALLVPLVLLTLMTFSMQCLWDRSPTTYEHTAQREICWWIQAQRTR